MVRNHRISEIELSEVEQLVGAGARKERERMRFSNFTHARALFFTLDELFPMQALKINRRGGKRGEASVGKLSQEASVGNSTWLKISFFFFFAASSTGNVSFFSISY